MFSLEALRQINDEADRRAKREGKEPLRIALSTLREAQGIGTDNTLSGAVRGIPVFGTIEIVEKLGYERVQSDDGEDVTFFVDKSGFGSESEPAMTLRRFVEAVRETTVQYGTSPEVDDDDVAIGDPVLYWAAHDEGQFQLYCTAFRKVEGAEPPEDWGEPDYCPKCGEELGDGEDEEDCSYCEHERWHCAVCGRPLDEEGGYGGCCLKHADPDDLDDDQIAEMALVLATDA